MESGKRKAQCERVPRTPRTTNAYFAWPDPKRVLDPVRASRRWHSSARARASISRSVVVRLPFSILDISWSLAIQGTSIRASVAVTSRAHTALGCELEGEASLPHTRADLVLLGMLCQAWRSARQWWFLMGMQNRAASLSQNRHKYTLLSRRIGGIMEWRLLSFHEKVCSTRGEGQGVCAALRDEAAI